MNHDFTLRGGVVLTSTGPERADVAIYGGRIMEIGSDIEPTGEVLDVGGLLLSPGGVDPHAHIEQRSGMGLMNADTFESATRSAALGGTTSVISFAAQGKGERLQEVVDEYTRRAERGAITDYAFHLSLSDPDVPQFEQDLRALIAAGHRSVKVFTTYNIALSEEQIARILEITGPLGALTCVHAEDDALLKSARNTLLQNGKTTPKHHAEARPREAERRAVAQICALAGRIGAPVMIFHVTCAEALAEVRDARARGAPVWAETCPHYLLMTDEILDQPGLDGAKWMCSPPQRKAEDQAALWDGLADGTLDLVSSDHAPYRIDETGKLSTGPLPDFPDIANGLPGLETRLPLMFDALISRRSDPSAFVNWGAANAARIYNLPRKGQLLPGHDADITLWDPSRSHTYGANDLHDNVGYNPYEGHRVTGWPVDVFRRGERIVTDGVLTAEPGSGAWIDRRGAR